mmetsp:Transcript_24905/g.78852  ORF Transcript_24905/g.78852 Transcript_24905/m.78852 type:complete len:211 (+) Transcript_24905:599-1231(+)
MRTHPGGMGAIRDISATQSSSASSPGIIPRNSACSAISSSPGVSPEYASYVSLSIATGPSSAGASSSPSPPPGAPSSSRGASSSPDPAASSAGGSSSFESSSGGGDSAGALSLECAPIANGAAGWLTVASSSPSAMLSALLLFCLLHRRGSPPASQGGRACDGLYPLTRHGRRHRNLRQRRGRRRGSCGRSNQSRWRERGRGGERLRIPL